jgi:hypothetical protein
VSSVQGVANLRVEHLWRKEVFRESGEHVGRIEAVGIGRDGSPRRVGVRWKAGGRALAFFHVARVRLDGSRVLLADDPPLTILSSDRLED